jgi:curli biogenesis system outer membrane secretion channel CsgG
MRTLKALMCFAACWALAGSLSAEDAKDPVEKPEPKISPNNAAVKASNDFACDLYRSLDQENRGKNRSELRADEKEQYDPNRKSETLLQGAAAILVTQLVSNNGSL